MSDKKTNCVIFDCEGTLVDSERLCCEALVNIFNDLGVELTFDDVAAHFAGGKIAEILNSTLELVGMSADLTLLESRYRRAVKRLLIRELQPMDGAVHLLDTLRHHQVEFCVASNAPPKRIEFALKLAGLLPYFEGRIFSAFEANSWKPEPDLIRYCAMNMGFRLDECVYVDDTAKGVEAGVLAGVTTYQLQPLNQRNRTTYQQVVILDKIDNLSQFVVPSERLSGAR
ncbi:HAD-IA family hydrolase [Vibrio sp. ABG19]|uniref:HAD-IA family hydrolase n=1 Tax=Vibrio sp. ABG19 TaxID=2817385 RepID=UPI00249DD8B0|nr:HAD-IA family hydrolase [Vibrio sp. ABG19]WGY45339.1 HAD-IA family hydrolase [Vibrio sp. ABG19]